MQKEQNLELKDKYYNYHKKRLNHKLQFKQYELHDKY